MVGLRRPMQRACQQALPLLEIGNLLLMGHRKLLGIAMRAHAFDVTAGTERRAGAGDEHRADIGIVAAALDHPPQRRAEIVRQRIARLRAVQRDDRDAVADHAEQLIGAGVDGDLSGHVVPPKVSFR